MNKPKPRRRRLLRLLLLFVLVPVWWLGWILYYFEEDLRRTRFESKVCQ